MIDASRQPEPLPDGSSRPLAEPAFDWHSRIAELTADELRLYRRELSQHYLRRNTRPEERGAHSLSDETLEEWSFRGQHCFSALESAARVDYLVAMHERDFRRKAPRRQELMWTPAAERRAHASITRQIECFMVTTGLHPDEFSARWQAKEIEDNGDNCGLALEAYALSQYLRRRETGV